jgi:hypothetical protein
MEGNEEIHDPKCGHKCTWKGIANNRKIWLKNVTNRANNDKKGIGLKRK